MQGMHLQREEETPMQSHMGFAEWVPLCSGFEPGDRGFLITILMLSITQEVASSLKTDLREARREPGLSWTWF